MVVLNTKMPELKPSSMGISKASMPRTKSRMATPANPGLSSGSSTLEKVVQVDAPLPRAASSRDGSMRRMVPAMSRNASGLMLTPSTQIMAGSE